MQVSPNNLRDAARQATWLPISGGLSYFWDVLPGTSTTAWRRGILGCRGGMRMETSTDELLAAKFPGIHKTWLRRISRKLKLLKQENGGNVEMTVRWKHGIPQWTQWNQRDICEMSPTQD